MTSRRAHDSISLTTARVERTPAPWGVSPVETSSTCGPRSSMDRLISSCAFAEQVDAGKPVGFLLTEPCDFQSQLGDVGPLAEIGNRVDAGESPQGPDLAEPPR